MTDNPLSQTQQVGSIVDLISPQGMQQARLAAPGMATVDATQVTFTPSNPGVWPLPVPTTVQAALDLLSQITAQQQSNAGALGPALTITFTTASVTSVGSGVYLVLGFLAATASGVSTQAGQLLLDGATVLDTAKAGTGGAGPWDMVMGAIVSVARGSSHTFAVTATASAGTNTAAIGDAKIILLELD